MGSRPSNILTKNLTKGCKYYDSPVETFVEFITERDSIRKKKEAGLPRPWTDDHILINTKFTNINRRYDKVSRFNQEFLDPIKDDVQRLWLNCLAIAHINKIATMNHFGSPIPIKPDPKKWIATIRQIKPMYGTAYQCPAQYKTILGYDTREEYIFEFLPDLASLTWGWLTPNKSITEMLVDILPYYTFKNEFATVQALLQLSEVRPDIVSPASEIPIGVGAKPLLNHMYPDLTHREGVLELLKIPKVKELCGTFADVEHALCENRKYIELDTGIRKNTSRFRY